MCKKALTENFQLNITQFDVAVTGDLGTTLVCSVVPDVQSINPQTASYQPVLAAAVCVRQTNIGDASGTVCNYTSLQRHLYRLGPEMT